MRKKSKPKPKKLDCRTPFKRKAARVRCGGSAAKAPPQARVRAPAQAPGQGEGSHRRGRRRSRCPRAPASAVPSRPSCRVPVAAAAPGSDAGAARRLHGAVRRRAGRAPALARGLRPAPGQAAGARRRWACTAAVALADAAQRRGDADRRRRRATTTATRSQPEDAWGHDHLWWLDRMVRSDQPLVERMTLIWHDWFATSNDGVGQQQLMLDQNELFRRARARLVPRPAARGHRRPGDARLPQRHQNRRGPPERELRARADGAVHARRRPRRLHRDRRARAGARADRLARRLERRARRTTTSASTQRVHDTGNKTVFGQDRQLRLGRTPCRLCVEQPAARRRSSSRSCGATSSRRRRPTPTAPALEQLYVASGYAIRPVVEAILLHPELYDGPRMVKPPVVYLGRHAARAGRSIDTDAWVWLSDGMPASGSSARPNVAGWDDDALARHRARCAGAGGSSTRCSAARSHPGDGLDNYDAAETPEQAVRRGARLLGRPRAHDARRVAGADRASPPRACPARWPTGSSARTAAMRQNALRHLIATAPPTARSRMTSPSRAAAAATATRAAAAAPRRGRGRAAACPRSSRACPLPAGTGPHAPLVPAARGRPGAGGLRRGRPRPRGVRGGHRARPPRRPTAACSSRSSSPAGLDSLSVLAPTGDPRYADAAPDARAGPDAGHAVRRGPAPALAPVGARRSRRCTREGKVTVLPAIGYTGAQPVALHVPPLLGGRRARPAAPLGLAGPLPRPARGAGQPAPGADARLRPVAALARRSVPVAAVAEPDDYGF